MIEAMGFDTGLDIEALIALRGKVERWLPTEKLHGMVSQAGLPKTFGTCPSGI
jgi:hydroxymethylglutaryl-CoA lyase